ncbi:flagellar filament capping protein FliD [Paenibacillus sp. P96]|uniref:Flagellar hook-associated protein 2 n=1 Tax=Paenibacillus zeirhizosphaerae TaxID=2987519 RepID=A0ABT9FV44_9BACL|nr:flagellar filament capping protein FliD [Paenibacillus sp. P96]MDP4098593.1 flagellar filament capping protein FliD [Paenibacillus sp. P96]
MSMRVNGFSGMDIDSMVKSLMTVKRVPLDKLSQQKQTLEWTRDSYREMNSKIVQFNDKLAKLSKSEALNTKKSTVSGNTTAVKAEARADANPTAMTVEVTKLAQKANMQTGAGLEGATLNTTLEQLVGGSGSAQDTYELHINDKSVTFLKTDKLSTVIARINSEVSTVNASFDEVSGKLTITSKEYGKDITATGQDKTAKPSSLTTLLGMTTNAAQKGEVKVTSELGGTKTYTTDSDRLTVNGINLTILQTTGGTPSQITTQSDPAKAVETIKSFVDSYNELLGLMNSKVDEQKYRDFPPLTDEQKKDMKEDEIKKWEEKAKSGLLKNDSILSSTVTSMRSVISSNYKELSEIGITTGQYYENGKLYIDEAKLTEALTTNPDKMLSIFTGSLSDPKSKPIFSELSSELDDTLDLFSKKVGTSKFDTNASMNLKTESIMGEQLKEYNKRIFDMERKMTNWETRYYKQFTAMEQAMSQLQSQSSSLTSYLQ